MKNKGSNFVRKCDIETCKSENIVALGYRKGVEYVDVNVVGRMVSVKSEEERKVQSFVTYEMYCELAGT